MLAQQNDVSVLVTEDSVVAAASNVQVELAVALPQASSSKPSFTPVPISNRPFTPPLPPLDMTADSENVAKFRAVTVGTLTASPASNSNEQQSELGKAAMPSRALNSDSQTFASRLPSDSGLQTDNSFGRSPSASDVRFSDASGSASRNRFGDFGVSPAPKTENRFAPLSSSSSKAAASVPPSSPPVQPASRRFSPPVVASAKAEPPTQSETTKKRLALPNPPAPSNRFAQPATTSKNASPTTQLPRADHLRSNSLPANQSVSTTPITKAPQASAQSLLSPNSNSQSSRFASPQVNQSNAGGLGFNQASTTRSEQSKSFGASGLQNSSGFSSRTASSQNNVSSPMIQRQENSSSKSFSDSSSSSQSNSGISRLSSQSSQFGSQAKQAPLRGRPIENDLRDRGTSNRVQTNQNVASLNRSNDNVDRQSIEFAQQQLRDIQATSADKDGTPVRLMEMFLEPLSGNQRKQMVAQYWETYYDMAALKIATDYENWLNSISTSTGAEKGLLSAAQQMAADGQLAAEIQLGKSQSRLMDFMPNPRPTGFAPLPSDEPLVERYVTDYEKYKRVRSLPSSLRGIDPMLASTLKLITRRAATVSTAKKAADQAGQALRNRQIPLASAIAAGRIWRDSQLDMVASTVSYNQAISDFVLTLEPNRSPEQLTAFMLGAPKANPQSRALNPGGQSVLQPTRSANQQQLGFPPNRTTQFR